ncbi:hypothetical protein HUT18_22070 [Streptomyces sp. NA04227]|uniref:hypothetical protein n=1 Tax=Streptomyces sp. NA04227 TaxID=2742136 RepID=UPI0015904C6B|nr:hypothetical protein [Streptomyces sp. NA04227]QKW08663.1 hypothetical protein HUT18_22070 [Streptomyces sp. NA04227]
MSYSYPPPQQPPQGPGPYGPPQGGGFPPQGPPPQQGWPPQGFQPRPYGGGPQGPGRRELPALGFFLGLVAAVIFFFVYAVIIEDAEDEHLVGWLGLLFGPALGFLMGLVGGRSPGMPIASALLGPVAMYFGQIMGICLLLTATSDQGTELFFEEFSHVSELWKENLVGVDILYFIGCAVLGAVAAFAGGRVGRPGPGIQQPRMY